jgi:hypothetical protein
VRLVKVLETVTSCKTPEVATALEASPVAGAWTKPPGRVGTEIVLFGVWMVMVGWPIVQGLCCMVMATAPGTVCAPPTPNPAPPAGVSGTTTLAYMQAANFKQIFAVPERPMGPPPGAAERPAKLAPRFAIPVKITELMVAFEVTGSESLTGPRSPPPIVTRLRWSPARAALRFTTTAPPPGASRPGSVDSWNVSVPEYGTVAAPALPATPSARKPAKVMPSSFRIIELLLCSEPWPATASPVEADGSAIGTAPRKRSDL